MQTVQADGLATGTTGVWCTTDGMSAREAATFAGRLAELGYTALWLPETFGRDPFAHIGYLAAQAPALTYATGIANIHHRHPGAMAQAARTLAECGQFVLGLGVSHAPLVEGLRQLDYGKPLQTMRTYLDTLDAAPYAGPGDGAPPRVLAALGPKMLALASERSDGAHTYWSTPEHTATARQILGAGKLLCVEQKVVLTDDVDAARAMARKAMRVYDTLPNYRNHWLRLGFDVDAIDTHADAFIDALVAYGDVDAIVARLDAHRAAGADHVCIQPLTVDKPFAVDMAALEQIAGALG